MDQSHLGTTWYVPGTSCMRQSVIGTKQAILHYDQKNSGEKLVLITCHVSHSDLRKRC